MKMADVTPCSLVAATSVSEEMLLLSLFTLKKEIVSASKMLLMRWQAARRHIPEGSKLHSHHRKSLKPHRVISQLLMH
jgi:hypothetical protein